MSKKPKLRVFMVKVEYKARGTIQVEALTERAACVAVVDELQCSPTCEVVDWDVLKVTEEAK
jgi:hypothetical protein